MVELFFSFICGQIFQSLMVSSAATLATVELSGDVVRSRTLLEWPVRSATFISDSDMFLGYFQMVNWLWLNPCPVTSSLYSVFQTMLDTWLPVSQLNISVMLLVFHTRTVRSTVPPAVASTLDCHGHQDTALTADWCEVMVCSGVSRPVLHTCTQLSLPPEAKVFPSWDHERPQTSCW